MKTIPVRQIALAWWNQLSEDCKQPLCNQYYLGRLYQSLTGREIENIWGAENQPSATPAPPVHQEQGAQENVKGTTGCQLSNSELIRSLREWNSKLCNTGGSAWSLQVPVSLDKDPDILIEEICQRLVAMESYRTQSTEVKTQGPDNNHIKIAYFKRDLINWKESFAQDFPPSSIQFIRQISDLLNKYFASPSHPQVESAGVWVKASERISGHYVKVCCRRIEHPDHWFTAHWDYSKRIYVTYNDNNSWISKDEIEWLDEKK